MKKLLLLFVMAFTLSSFAQKGKDTAYINKTYIFTYNAPIAACDALGTPITDGYMKSNGITDFYVPKTAYKSYLFTVENVDTATGDLIIRFHIFKKTDYPKPSNLSSTDKADNIKYTEWRQKCKEDSAKVDKENVKFYQYNVWFSNTSSKKIKDEAQSDANTKFFRLKKRDFDNSCRVNVPAKKLPKWDFTYGPLTVPFKIRNFFNSGSLAFTPNLSLGGAIYGQRKITPNFSVGGVAGISVSSITLDSVSTKGAVKTSSTGNTRPSLTMTAQILIAYKNINVIAGVGFDFIDIASPIERSWIYQGKPWFGLGIGVNLFNGGSTAPQAPSSGQIVPKK
ncbi:MAG TPA: hypothetical protein VNX01_15965 [Bacteroidia bacterium]|nr:hypothetical protein [Bacteroidia bacterium]